MFKQIFTSIILSLFYPEGTWLNELTSMDHMVDNNSINLSVVGADPSVVKDNQTWPLTPARRTDSGITISLATFDTLPTHVTNVEEMETSYDKCVSVAQQHVNVLRSNAAKSAAYNIGPAANTANTPILATTGADRGDGKKALRWEDLTSLSLAFDAADIPQDGRILLLSPQHKKDLKDADIKLYKTMLSDNTVDSFKVYTFNYNPRYLLQAGSVTKQAYGAVTGNESSVAFVKSEVMRAMGTIEGEPEKRWADYRGWLLGFQLRFVAIPFRNKGIGAIYSASVSV
ncbi:MAG: hypothetical protein LBU62_03255 [Bacteroidales bacterium]|jgi:hypothetical protein|nr:hypothetical protein [Bacteroidales bacterium]